MPHVAHCMHHTACDTLRAKRCTRNAARETLHAKRCMRNAACNTPREKYFVKHTTAHGYTRRAEERGSTRYVACRAAASPTYSRCVGTRH
eukprot:4235678-Pleurochrysis_carterae.AAC.1